MHDNKIERPLFTNWLSQWRDKDVIKVVTGIHRCGKTTLFELFRDKLRNDGIKKINAIDFLLDPKSIETR